MEREQFIAIMPYITADLANMIAEKKGISENEAVTRLYKSKLYSDLEREETKVWQYSTQMLYSLFEGEVNAGSVCYPDV